MDAALRSAHVTLADPIFWEYGPIDVTYIRGDWAADFTGHDPWAFLRSVARELPEPEPRGKRR